MGWTAAALVASTALSIGSSMHSSNKQAKAQKKAEAQAREAAKRNVTVQSSGAEPTRASENVEAGEEARQNAKKRRQGYASTINNRGLTSSLVGNKSILGG